MCANIKKTKKKLKKERKKEKGTAIKVFDIKC